MADEAGNNSESSNTSTGDESSKVTFSAEQQEAINKIIADRLAQQERAQAKKDEEAKKTAEIEKLSGEERLKAQYKADLDKITAERDGATKQVRLLKAESSIAKLGYTDANAVSELAKLIVSSAGSDEEVSTSIETVDKLLKSLVQQQLQDKLAKGTPPKPANNSGSDTMLEKMRRAAGLSKP